MSNFNFEKAFSHFSEPMSRNILFVGENFDFEKDAPLLSLKWNLIFTFLTSREDIVRLQGLLQNDSRLAQILTENLDEVEKIPNQFDTHNLNLIALKDLREDDEKMTTRANNNSAQNTIANLCAAPVRNCGYVYFVGYTEDSWFIPDVSLMNAMEKVYGRENCIIIDRCGAGDFADLRKEINAIKDCNCFVLAEEALVDQWANLIPKPENIVWDDEDDYEPITDSSQLMFFAGQKPISIPRKELRSIASFATLLDYEEMTPERRKKWLHPTHFAAFLKNNTNYPKWFAYAEHYALVRSYQQELTNIVRESLEHPANYDHRPILLHGQSGAGKSVALGQLAYDIFHEKKYPVIYITNPNVSFSFAKDDSESARCYRALLQFITTLQEEYNVKSVLLIWDCSGFEHERANYHRLYSRLRNSGLNVTLVGTNYQLSKNASLLKEFYDIPAEIKLNADELIQFRSILKNKAKLDTSDIDELLRHSKEDNFLAILYNIFYDIRNDISRGIYTEFRETVKDVLSTTPDTEAGMLGNIFIRNFDKLQSLLEDMNTEESKQEQLKEFSIYMAILTYFNMSMSVDMIFGMLSTNQESLQKALGAPMFTASSQNGVWHYKVRSRLEAEMLLRAHQLNPRNKDNKEQYTIYFTRLLHMIETSKFASGAKDEAIEKITRILSVIGPNNQENDTLRWPTKDFCRYAPCLIAALNEAAEVHKEDPRLWVQNLTLTREYIGKTNPSQDNKSWDEDDADKTLYEPCSYEEFCHIMRTARDEKSDEFFEKYKNGGYLPNLEDKYERGKKFVDNDSCTDYTLKTYFDQLRVEVANVLLSIARKDEEHPDPEQLRQVGLGCTEAMKSTSQQTKERAFNTLIWSKAHLLKTQMSDAEAQKLAVDTIDKIFTAIQRNKELANNPQFISPCKFFFEMLDKNLNIETLTEKLKVEVTPAILYCCAFQECRAAGLIDTNAGALRWKRAEDEEVVREIYNKYFAKKEYEAKIYSDIRCRDLQMRLLWLMYNKDPLLVSGERQKTHLSAEMWDKLIDICALDNNILYPENTFYLRFVYALALLHRGARGDINACNQVFYALREESEEMNTDMRIITRYLLCDENGNPKKVSGTIRSMENNVKGKIDLLDSNNMPFAQNVFFNVNDISAGSKLALRPGDRCEDLCVGISFMGISATRDKEGRR